jgi:hypothetical protein
VEFDTSASFPHTKRDAAPPAHERRSDKTSWTAQHQDIADTCGQQRVKRVSKKNRGTLRRKPLKVRNTGFASQCASFRTYANPLRSLGKTGEVSAMSCHSPVHDVLSPCQRRALQLRHGGRFRTEQRRPCIRGYRVATIFPDLPWPHRPKALFTGKTRRGSFPNCSGKLSPPGGLVRSPADGWRSQPCPPGAVFISRLREKSAAITKDSACKGFVGCPKTPRVTSLLKLPAGKDFRFSSESGTSSMTSLRLIEVLCFIYRNTR